MVSFSQIKKQLNGKLVFFEVISNSNGKKSLSLLFDDQSLNTHYFIHSHDRFDDLFNYLIGMNSKICWKMDTTPRSHQYNFKTCDTFDLSTILGSDSIDNSISSLLKDYEIELFLKRKKTFDAYHNSATIAKVDFNSHSLNEIVPNIIITEFYKEKIKTLKALWETISNVRLDLYKLNNYERLITYFSIEKTGVFVDLNIEHTDPSIGDEMFTKSVQKLLGNRGSGIVFTKFNTRNPTRTGRVHPMKKSFRCMNIPKSKVRRIIKSRYKDGLILSIDMNATDYRCIISAVDDPFINSVYDDCDDFHNATVKLIFGDNSEITEVRRTIIKQITYTAIYGGSITKLQGQTGLSKTKLLTVLKKIKPISSKIKEYNKVLITKSKENGFIDNLLGSKIKLNGKEHDGQILALFAQSRSSSTFMLGVSNLYRYLSNLKTSILFTVHDEVVIEVRKEDLDKINEMKRILEISATNVLGYKMTAKMKIGKNYWDIK